MSVLELSPAQRAYRPFGVALDLLYCREKEVVLSGPAGTGKSRACLEKLHLCAEKYPGMRGLIVRKTRESLTESALVTFEDKVLPEGHPAALGPQRNERRRYCYPNGSEIVVGGLRQSGKDMTQKVMSTEYDLIYAQEAIELSEEEWEKLTTRLRNGVMPFQQLIADTNPDHPQHWLKQRSDRGQTLMLESRHEDNPVLFDHARARWTEFGEEYLATLDALTGARRDRLRFGRWVQSEGAVYEDWDPLLHLVDRMPRGWESWRKLRSIDFGFSNPFVCQWWAIDPDGRMYLYREIYRTQRTVRDHAAEIRRLSAGERIEATVADHDAEDRATLAQEGIPTVAAIKTLSVGIQAVQERLRRARDGRPRLFVLRGALAARDESLAARARPWCTEQEWGGYVWPKGQDGKPLKEEPVDENNHGLDAARYAVMHIDQAGVRGPIRQVDRKPATAGLRW